MGTPLGDFVRAKRDSTAPESVGLSSGARRRAPGLRRTELAALAGISVEYLSRMEQGANRNPSPAVIAALAGALALPVAEREHLRYLAKITGGACAGPQALIPVTRAIRESTADTLALLESGVAYVTNRLGDILAHTSDFASVMAPLGLLDASEPNLTRYVFTDPRAKTHLPDWEHIADELAFHLWMAPSVAASESFRVDLAPIAGPAFTGRLKRPVPPPPTNLRMIHPDGRRLEWRRAELEVREDAQQLVVLLPADAETADALLTLRGAQRSLRAA